MADKDLFEDGRRKKSFVFTEAPWQLTMGRSLTVSLPKNTLPFVDSHVNHPFTVVTLVSPKPFN
jgi:hypothetical protein